LCTKLDLEADKVGLSFDNDKAQLLLPPGWALPLEMRQYYLDSMSALIFSMMFTGKEWKLSALPSVRYAFARTL